MNDDDETVGPPPSPRHPSESEDLAVRGKLGKLRFSVSERDIEDRRERFAGVFAFSLLVVFGLTILSPPIYWISSGTPPPPEFLSYAKEVAGLEATLLGAIAGFYFSQKRLP